MSAKNESSASLEPPQKSPPTRSDAWFGGILAVLGALGLINIKADPWLKEGTRGTDPGPSFLPEIYLWILAVFGVVHLIGSMVRARRAGGFAPSREFELRRLWLPAALFLSLVLYYLVLEKLGYLLASAVFALLWVPIIHWRSGRPFLRRHIIQLPLESLAIVAALYGLFRLAIGVPLP